MFFGSEQLFLTAMLVKFDFIPVSVYLKIKFEIASVFGHGFGLEEIFIITRRQKLIILRSVQVLMESELCPVWLHDLSTYGLVS